jgi:TonB-dependent receptor
MTNNINKGLAMKKDKNPRSIRAEMNTHFKKSALAMCVIALSSPSFAQDTEDQIDEIIVSGVRANLQNAQDIKRNADTFVDSISASDIGSLPDRSVLEAMQRLPGVSIERFAAANDPDHFGVEGSGAVIRGMSATRSEFNGRDSFTANSGRGLSFQDVPPELMGGVDLYKNQSADMVEGGIGGTVSLRTRKPFDSQGRMFSISGDVSYGDMAEKASPTISALYSDRWDTAAGEFGVLFNIADSSLKGVSHGIQSDAYVQYMAQDPNPDMDTNVYSSYPNQTLPGAEAFVGDGTGIVWMPNGSNATMKLDDRDRRGYAAAFQWENPDDTILGTFQFMRSDAELAWTENAIKYQGGYYDVDAAQDLRRTRPLTGTEFEFDDKGIFQQGFLTDSDGWRTANGHTERVPRSWVDGDAPLAVGQWGHPFQTDTRYKSTRTVVDDFSFNLKFTPNENWEYSVDLQYIQAETEDDDITIMLATHAMQDYDTRSDTPTLTLVQPWNGLREENENLYAEGAPGFSGDPAGDSNWFQDPTSYWWQSAMDHYERSEGDSIAGRFDVNYTVDDSFIKVVRAGVRYADREQTVRNSVYNWGALGPRWTEDILWADDSRVTGQEIGLVDWSDFHRGGVITIEGDSTLHPSVALARDVINRGRELAVADGDWTPAAARDGAEGFFVPSEIYVTSETNEAAYVRFDFGSDDFARRFEGNVGLRYVKLERDAAGSVQYPDLLPENPIPSDLGLPQQLTRPIVEAWAAEEAQAEFEAPDSEYATYEEALDFTLRNLPQWAREQNNYLDATDRGFGNNAYVLQDATSTYSTVLPSFNLKVELTDDLISRFAVSKAIALPDMEAVKNQANLGTLSVTVIQPPEPPPGTDPDTLPPSGILAAEVSGWRGESGNPFLKPMESIQYDASLEWYFAPVGSLTATVFYKDLSNFFIHGAFPREFTNPVSGITQVAEVEGTRNGGDGTMQGFEIAYQQFYDMLPEPWDGLGLQVNYTYIKASGVPNGGDGSVDEFEGTSNDTGARVSFDSIPLQGQSKDTFNLVGMYDKNDWSVRLAYNWRSKYLLTTRDVISKYPLWNDAAGFLDASAFYDVNDSITVGLQFTNLLNTQTKTIMILDGQGAEAGRSWFVNDRRAALIVRAAF